MPCNMSLADWIYHVVEINERPSLLNSEAKKLRGGKIIREAITPNIPREWERDYILKEGDKTKTLKAVKTILKTIKKAHGSNKVEEKPSAKKKIKTPAPNPTDTNKCRLLQHKHSRKNCPNNPSLKNYDETHYFKIQEQERAGTPTPNKNEDKSTKSDNESKRPHKKRHRHRERGEIKNLNSIDSDTIYGSNMVKFSQVRDSVGSAYSTESESTGVDVSDHVSIESLFGEHCLQRQSFLSTHTYNGYGIQHTQATTKLTFTAD